MIIYGAAFGNVLQDVGFHFGWDVQYYQDESFVGYLLNPFAMLCGVLPLALSIHQAGPLMVRLQHQSISEQTGAVRVSMRP